MTGPARAAEPGSPLAAVEELLPGARIVASWAANAPLARLPGPIEDRLAALLEELRPLYGATGQVLADAVLAGDGRARAALAQLDAFHDQALDQLMPRIRQAKLRRDWHALAHQARLAVHLAGAAGRRADLALAAHLLANALAGLGDLAGAVQAFRRSIAAAAAVGDVRLQAVGHGNLGNTLRDTGDCDAALFEYASALDLEADPRGRAVVQSNRAEALQRLGERASALQAQLDQLSALEAAGAPAAERAVTLARAAQAALESGGAGRALALLGQADTLVEPDDLPGRVMLAGLRARAAGMQHDAAGADAADQHAWELALDHAVGALQRLAPRYAQGFATALAHRLPTEHALRLLIPGIAGKDANRWTAALQSLHDGQQQARAAGDLGLALRIAANHAAALADAGQVQQAQRGLQAVQAEAAACGLARPEAMAWGTLAAIAAQTGELMLGQDVTALQARSAALMDLHGQLLARSGLAGRDLAFESMAAERSTLLNECAVSASRRGAWTRAAGLFEQAAAAMRPYGASFPLANRLAGLLDACTRSGDIPRGLAAAAELTQLLPQLEPRARLVAARALALHLDDRDPPQALQHWQQAADLAEGLRSALPAGFDASEVNRGFARLPMQCAQRLRRAGRDAEAWRRLQEGKSRRILDARASGQALPRLEAVQAALRPDELLVDVAIEDEGLVAYRAWPDGFDTVFEAIDLATLHPPGLTDLREREQALLELARRHVGLAAWAARVADGAAQGRRLLLVPDGALFNLPLHEIRIGQQPWHERQPIGELPCAAWLLRASSSDAVLNLVAGNSAGDLPGAEDECRSIAVRLGVEALTGQGCTRAAIDSAMQAGPLDIVHLAVHGRGDVQRGARASLLLADGLGGTEWVPLEALAQRPWQANLVVLSGCSTGVAGPLRGHEMVSAARAVLEAGAQCVLASLWPVDDRVAAALMTAFHAEVAQRRAQGECDLRQALDAARRAVTRGPGAAAPIPALPAGRRRDGRHGAVPAASAKGADTGHGCRSSGVETIADALAPFVLVGLPILSASSTAPGASK
ncbi:MAG: CHAT domain-containing protein [Burkholderiales bacterium]|nr:CHAT domain-containing protein [Burkholderiales bacterium]